MKPAGKNLREKNFQGKSYIGKMPLWKTPPRKIAPRKVATHPRPRKLLKIKKIVPRSYITSNVFNKQPGMKSHQSMKLKTKQMELGTYDKLKASIISYASFT